MIELLGVTPFALDWAKNTLYFTLSKATKSLRGGDRVE